MSESNKLDNLEQYRGRRVLFSYRWNGVRWVQLGNRWRGGSVEACERSRRRWYTDGVPEVFSVDWPVGFRPGRLPGVVTPDNPEGLRSRRWSPCWWNNGVDEVRALECPPGYRKGALRGSRNRTGGYRRG